MAKRRVTRRFDTKEVQGKDSYVILSSLRVGERRAYVKASKSEDFSILESGVELLTKHVVEWNWVDEDDQLLALPKDDPKVMDELTDPESELLANLLMNPDAKN